MFKNILIELMQEYNLTQIELSKKAQIPPTTISGWLNNARLPDYNAIIKLSDFFEVTTDYILGKEDELGNKLDNQKNNNKQNKIKPQEEKEIINAYKNLSEEGKANLKQMLKFVMSEDKEKQQFKNIK